MPRFIIILTLLLLSVPAYAGEYKNAEFLDDINVIGDVNINSTTMLQRDVNNNVVVGDPSTPLSAGNSSLISIGDNISFSGTTSNSILIGTGVQALAGNPDNVILLGSGAKATAGSQFVVGSENFGVSTMYLGTGVQEPTPNNSIYTATGGLGTDIIGGNLELRGGRATGNAVGGSIIFETSDPGVSGVALQVVSEKLKIAADGTLTINQAYSMPTADGAIGEILRTDGAGALFFDPEVQLENFITAYDTTTQMIALINTFQTVTFDTNGTLQGWAHTPGSDAFTCNQTGTYLVNFFLHGEKSSGGAGNVESRLTIDNVEVAGSQEGFKIVTNLESKTIGTRSFLCPVVSGEVIRIEVAGDTVNYSIQPGPSPGSSTIQVSAGITIFRIK